MSNLAAVKKSDKGTARNTRRRTSGEHAGRWLLIVACLGVGALLFWADNAQIAEVAKARGQVIAASRTQVIQAAQSGSLTELLVQEGVQVKKGQVLARFERSRMQAGYEESLSKVMALRAALVRLRAEVFAKPPVFGPEFKAWPAYVSNQKALFSRRQRALNDSVNALGQMLGNVHAELRITVPLEKYGDVGLADILRLKRQEAELVGQIANAKNKYFQDAQSEMTKAEEDLSGQEQVMAERQALLEHTEIHAPMDGIVKRVQITTLGAAVREGEVIMELVPIDDKLIVEAKFQPADLAFVHVGLPAYVKLDSYDYSIYGQAKGIVTYISPDALSEQDSRMGEKVYYRVHVRITDLPVKKVRGKSIYVQPGMTAEVEVRTGERTILEYLAKPVIKTLSESLSER
jgi:adhesin transport system membrane fusion protein